MNDIERIYKIFKMAVFHFACILFCAILGTGIAKTFDVDTSLESNMYAITLISYIMTGWVLYEIFLKKRSKSAWIQAIGWMYFTNPLMYMPFKDDIEWLAKLRIF